MDIAWQMNSLNSAFLQGHSISALSIEHCVGSRSKDSCQLRWMDYKELPLKDAVHEVIWNKIDKMEGSGGGVICIDCFGNIVMDFNTHIMYRAWATASGESGAAVNK